MRDVIIIGGGMVGLCCAWHLRQAGMQVTIIDKGDFTDGCSYGNAGMIVPSHFTPLASPGMLAEGLHWMFRRKSPFYIRPRLNVELMAWLWKFIRSSNAKHVEQCAPVLLDLHQESKDIYKTWSSLPGFDFDLREKGIVMLYQTAKAEKHEHETAEKANALGLETRILSPEQLRILEPKTTLSVLGAVYYPGDATFSPPMFMKQMIGRLRADDVEFIPKSEIISIKDLGTVGCEIKSLAGKEYKSKFGVVAAGAWSSGFSKSSARSMLMQGGKGYSITWDEPLPAVSIPSLLHEARVSLTPMGHQLRIGGTLEIGGWNEKISAAKIKWITESLTRYYPDLKVPPNEKIWYGYRPCTPDGMPYIGRLKPDAAVMYATGHSMMGVSLAPATGRMVSNALLRKERIPAILSPNRR